MTKRCFIFGAAPISGLPIMPTADDFTIAADGGLAHLKRLGIKADIILGDFDSLRKTPDGDNVIVHPVEKDATDMALAISEAVSRGYKHIYLYGGTGGARMDHTIANLQTIGYYAQFGVSCFLMGNGCVTTAIHNQSVTFGEDCTGILSVFCQGYNATGVTLENVKYPLQDHTLSANVPLGVSNQFIGKPARITVQNGILLLMFDEKNLAYYKQ